MHIMLSFVVPLMDWNWETHWVRLKGSLKDSLLARLKEPDATIVRLESHNVSIRVSFYCHLSYLTGRGARTCAW